MRTLEINEELDDGSDQYKNGIKIFKLFDGVGYKGSIIGYNHKNWLYQVKYEGRDKEDFYSNEIYAHKNHQLPCHKCWKQIKKKRRQEMATNILVKIAPTAIDCKEHIHLLSIDKIRSIVSIMHNNLDMTDIPTEMVQLCINTLNSNKMTPE